MTLQEWCDRNGVRARRVPTAPNARTVALPVVRDEVGTGLWILDDYSVTAVQAGVAWLVPRKTPAPEKTAPLPVPLPVPIPQAESEGGRETADPGTHDVGGEAG